MWFILMLLIVLSAPFGIHLVQKRVTNPERKKAFSYAAAAGLTLAYWLYESQAGGNIRIDLLLFYPALFASYTVLFWWRLKWLAFIPALVLMTLNFGFFVNSYGWFDKYPG